MPTLITVIERYLPWLRSWKAKLYTSFTLLILLFASGLLPLFQGVAPGRYYFLLWIPCQMLIGYGCGKLYACAVKQMWLEGKEQDAG